MNDRLSCDYHTSEESLKPETYIDQVRKILQRDSSPYKNIPLESIPKSVLKQFLELKTLPDKSDDPETKQKIRRLRGEPVYWGLVDKLIRRTDDPLERLEKRKKAVKKCQERKKQKKQHEIRLERNKSFAVFKNKLKNISY